jgi:hypothetical protein
LSPGYYCSPLRLSRRRPPPIAIAAGSVTDVIARASAAELAPRLGQQLVIENRGGANGIPAADACKNANPDGYTICLLNHGHFSFNPLQFNKLPYDPDTDRPPLLPDRRHLRIQRDRCEFDRRPEGPGAEEPGRAQLRHARSRLAA